MCANIRRCVYACVCMHVCACAEVLYISVPGVVEAHATVLNELGLLLSKHVEKRDD